MNLKAIFKTSKFNSNNVHYLNHYTTMSAVRCILANRSLRLSRIDKVNDLLESTRVDKFEKLKGFVGCFTKRQEESYFFWKVYSMQNSDDIGIRITFPSDIVNQGDYFYDPTCTLKMPNVTRTDVRHFSHTENFDWGIFAKNNYKVIYIEDINLLRYEDKHLKSFLTNCVVSDNDFSRNVFPYIVKTKEWNQEEEVRILTQVRPRGRETILGRSLASPNFYPQPPFTHIYLKLSDDLLRKCVFTISPLCTEKFEEAKKEILALLDIDPTQIQISKMYVRCEKNTILEYSI